MTRPEISVFVLCPVLCPVSTVPVNTEAGPSMVAPARVMKSVGKLQMREILRELELGEFWEILLEAF